MRVDIKFGQRLAISFVTTFMKAFVLRDVVDIESAIRVLSFELRHLEEVVGGWRRCLLRHMLCFLWLKVVAHAKITVHRR